MTPAGDKRVVQCNYARATVAIPKGARAYLVLPNPGGGADRVEVLARSRGGRWVRKWESIRNLTGFRIKTIPPEHPMYGDDRLYPAESARRFLSDVGADKRDGEE